MSDHRWLDSGWNFLFVILVVNIFVCIMGIQALLMWYNMEVNVIALLMEFVSEFRGFAYFMMFIGYLVMLLPTAFVMSVIYLIWRWNKLRKHG